MKNLLLFILIFLVFIPNIQAQPRIGIDIAPFGSQAVWPVDANLETFLDRMQEGGIQWGRFDLCWWSLCELVQGEYDFTSPNYPGYEGWNTDRAITLMQDRGIEPFPILCYGNSLYDNGQGPYSDTGRTAFGNYCYAAAERYRESVYYWEIWNEPNQELFWGRTPDPADYARLAIHAAGRIRQANPKAVIAGGVTSGIDLAFLNIAFQNGLLDAVDAITIHPYRVDASPESINSEVATLRSMIAARTQRPIQIWTGEWGYNTAWSSVTELGQAKILSRMIVNNLSQGIDLSIWFSIHAFAEITTAPDDPQWGLLDYSLQPRPSFYAMQVLNQRLSAPVSYIGNPLGITFSPIRSGQRAELFERETPNHLTVAIWSATWPLSDSYAGQNTRIQMEIPDETEISAYDGLTGDLVSLNISRNENKTQLNNFLIRDYPVFLDLQIPENALFMLY